MNTDNGGPAFPTTKPLDSWDDPNQGMSLRDYFAAKAMQSFATKYYHDVDDLDAHVARHSYQLADAMLAERERSAAVTSEKS